MHDDPSKKWYGVHWTHLQAFQAALQLQHPMDMQVAIRDILIQAIFSVLTLGTAKVLEMRAYQHKRILEMIQSNEEEEKRLPQDVQLVLRGKRSLVWRRLLRETCYPDMGIVSGVVEGLKLVGSSTKSNAFPSGLYLAQLSLQSIWRRRSTIGKCQALMMPKQIVKTLDPVAARGREWMALWTILF